MVKKDVKDDEVLKVINKDKEEVFVTGAKYKRYAKEFGYEIIEEKPKKPVAKKKAPAKKEQ